MRLSRIWVALLGLVVVPGIVSAQNYQQDFSATFPPPVANPGKVTVIMTNESGETIVPYLEYEVPGLTAYAGRPQVAGRTGGANANQEVSEIVSTYTLGGTDTVVNYTVDPLPEVDGVNYLPDRVLDDSFITLSEDGIGSIQSAAAWDEQYNGDYDVVNHTFAFRISGTGNPANDQADGMGWAYLNSADFDTAGVAPLAIGEEPNFAGSLGVGFDIWNNGGEGGNSISMHFDGRVLENRIIDDGTTDPDGNDWEFNSFETDEIIATTIIVTPGDSADQLVPVLKGGSPYSVWNRSGRPSEIIQEGGAESMEGRLRIAEEASGVANVVAFDYDGSGASDEYHAKFNFRGLNENANRADGMSFLLVPTNDYGDTGAETIDFGPHEEPNLLGAFGVGFDTFNDDIAAQDDPEGMANVGNHVSVHFDGVKLTQENFDPTELDLVTDDPNTWHLAQIDIVGDTVAVTIIDGVDGSEHVAFAETIPGLSQMGTVRPVFAARTGGAFDHYEIDNFLMTGAGSGILGDFNNNGVLDAADINDLTAKSAANSTDLTYDLTGDGNVNGDDVNQWISADNIFKSWPGDANLDKEFNSGDLVSVLSAGKYEVDLDAVWTEGDFNGDGRANSGDLVTALTGGGYELGPKMAVAAVPEPGSATLLLLGGLMFVRRRRK